MIFLSLLFFKHFICDFILQPNWMVRAKARYGDIDGITHSLLHCVFTLLIAASFVRLSNAYILALIDCVVHYHIDYIKARYTPRDMVTPTYWALFGFDQFAHAITYIILVSIY